MTEWEILFLACTGAFGLLMGDGALDRIKDMMLAFIRYGRRKRF